MPVAAYNVSGEYAMVKAAAAAGPARRARRRARGADRHPPRRRRHRDHLPREGRRPMAQPVARPRSAPAGRLGRPAGRDRQEAPEPHAGLVRAATATRSRASPSSPGIAEDEVMERVQYLLDKRIIREITPIFDTRALGYSLDARRGEGRRRATRTGRRSSSTRTRASRTTTCATTSSTSGSRSRSSPDSQARARRHARRDGGQDRRRVDPPAADAQAVQDPHGPRDGGRDRRAQDGRRGRRADGARPDRALRRSTRGRSGPRRGRWRCAATPTRRPPRSSACR